MCLVLKRRGEKIKDRRFQLRGQDSKRNFLDRKDTEKRFLEKALVS